MKKVILIYPKLGAYFTGRPPLSVLSVAAYLERANILVSVFDINQRPGWRQQLIKEADSSLCVGISAITGNQIKNGLEISRLIKKNFPQLPIIWGGVHPSLMPGETLKERNIDMVVRGEGEETLLDLVKALQGGQKLDDVLGLSFRKNGQIIHNPDRQFLDMNKLPNPAWHFVNIDNYYFSNLSSKNVALQTSRGCPHHCQFCYNSNFNKSTWRYMSAERILEMIVPLKEKYQIDGIVFWDDNFFVDFKRVKDFCELLIKNNLNIKWEADCRVDYLCRMDDDFLQLLKSSGLSALFLGAESGSQTTLETIQKGITVEQIVRSAEITAKFGFNVWYSFMLGFPEETKADVLSTIRLIKKIRKINPQANTAMKVFCPFPGTPLYQKAKRAGFILPDSLAECGNYHVEDIKTPWTKHKFSPYFPICTRFATEYNRFSGLFKNPFFKFLAKIFHLIEKFRWEHEFWSFPIELIIAKKIAKKLGLY